MEIQTSRPAPEAQVAQPSLAFPEAGFYMAVLTGVSQASGPLRNKLGFSIAEDDGPFAQGRGTSTSIEKVSFRSLGVRFKLEV